MLLEKSRGSLPEMPRESICLNGYNWSPAVCSAGMRYAAVDAITVKCNKTAVKY